MEHGGRGYEQTGDDGMVGKTWKRGLINEHITNGTIMSFRREDEYIIYLTFMGEDGVAKFKSDKKLTLGNKYTVEISKDLQTGIATNEEGDFFCNVKRVE